MMIDIGAGDAVVLIPGIQGRWEWMRRLVAALSTRWRVITGSLPGEPGETRKGDTFTDLTSHIDGQLNRAGVNSAVICGVSFGGLIALRYAAERPDRVRALILISTPGPRWTPAAYQIRHLRWPILTLPMFLAGAVRRAWRELRVTLPRTGQRIAFCASWASDIVRAPGIPWRMAARGRLARAENFEHDCKAVKVPTLVVAGDAELDQVVSVEQTMEYVRRIPGAQYRAFEGTGHLGVASSPERLAAIISDFLYQLPIHHA
jgi:pimeloyl-ACP methyl ester carboxylesterase